MSACVCLCVCACICVNLLLRVYNRECVYAVGSLLLRVKPHCKSDSYLIASNSFINKRPTAGV